MPILNYTTCWKTRLFPLLLLSLACSAPRQMPPAAITTASGLIYEIVMPGSGPIAQTGEMALIHETTRLGDGTLIVDTWAMNHPIRFLLGGKQVIDGVDEVVTGMRVGERRKVVVPPHLSKRTSYPENGAFGPQDTLHYDITLLQTSKP